MDNKVEYVKKLCHKSPTYKAYFIKLLESEKNTNVSIEQIESLFEDIQNYKSVLKKHQFNHIDYDTFESMQDKITRILEIHKAELLKKQLSSNKYRHLFNHKEIQKLLEECVRYKIEKTILQNYIGKKIARFNDKEELISAIKKILHERMEYSPEAVIEKINKKDLNVEIIKQTKDKLVLSVLDYEACKELGSPSWCITTSENSFNHYLNKQKQTLKKGVFDLHLNNIQLILIDFSIDSHKKESMIGITLQNNKYVQIGHYKDDDRLRKYQINKVLQYFELKDTNLSYEKEFIFNKIKQQQQNYKPEQKLITLAKYIDDIDTINDSYGKVAKLYKNNPKKIQSLGKQYLKSLLLFKSITQFEQINKVFTFYFKYFYYDELYTQECFLLYFAKMIKNMKNELSKFNGSIFFIDKNKEENLIHNTIRLLEDYNIKFKQYAHSVLIENNEKINNKDTNDIVEKKYQDKLEEIEKKWKYKINHDYDDFTGIRKELIMVIFNNNVTKIKEEINILMKTKEYKEMFKRMENKNFYNQVLLLLEENNVLMSKLLMSNGILENFIKALKDNDELNKEWINKIYDIKKYETKSININRAINIKEQEPTLNLLKLLKISTIIENADIIINYLDTTNNNKQEMKYLLTKLLDNNLDIINSEPIMKWLKKKVNKNNLIELLENDENIQAII